jgi:hypothetical protein
MKMKHVLSAGFGMLALGLVATTAQAGPVAGLGGAAVEADGASLLTKANWRGRGYYDGYRGFRGYRKPFGFGYGFYRRYGGYNRYGYGGYRGRYY